MTADDPPISSFHLSQWTDSRSFLEESQEFLLNREDVNAVVLGISKDIARSSTPDKTENFFGLVCRNEKAVAAAFMTPAQGRGAAVTEGPEGALALLAGALVEKYGSIPGVNGPKGACESFGRHYCSLTGERSRITFEMRIHRLEAVTPLSLPAGQLRRVQPGDEALLHRWLGDFSTNTLGRAGPSHESVAQMVNASEPRSYLWCVNGEAVSTAAWSRPTQTGISIKAVYTPPSKRGQGHGTAVVHGLSALLLKRGYAFCTLYTDLANPVSNAIYARIGYKPVMDTQNIRFVSTHDEPHGQRRRT